MSAREGDNVLLAIFLSLLALLLFDAMGLIIKLLSPRYSAAELSAWRNLFGLVPTAIALLSSRAWRAAGRPMRIANWPLALARGGFVTVAQLLFYFSLGRMEFATATTITYANALFMTALAIPLLGEKVGLIRWLAVAIGFVGVVLVMQPGREAFETASLAPLGAAFLYALAAVTARLFPSEVSSPLLNLYSAGTALIGSAALALALGGFSPIASGADALWIVAMGGFGGTAVLCLVIAYRMTEQSNLAPFSYFGIPFAFALGWLFYGETPFDALFPGAVLIVAGGLLVIWRERYRRKHA